MNMPLFHRTVMFFLLACSFLACSKQQQLRPAAYIQWVKSSDQLHVTKTIDDFSFDLQYQPAPYVWLMRQDVDHLVTNVSKNSIDSISNIQYFVVNISVNNNQSDFIDYGVSTMEEKQRKLYYFSYSFQNDIHLEQQGNILPCVLFHFEKPVDLKHSRTFILGFENPPNSNNETTLVITSDQFGSLPIKVTVSKKDIPELKI